MKITLQSLKEFRHASIFHGTDPSSFLLRNTKVDIVLNPIPASYIIDETRALLIEMPPVMLIGPLLDLINLSDGIQ